MASCLKRLGIGIIGALSIFGAQLATTSSADARHLRGSHRPTFTGPVTEWSEVSRWVLELTPTLDSLITKRSPSIRAGLWYVSDLG